MSRSPPPSARGRMRFSGTSRSGWPERGNVGGRSGGSSPAGRFMFDKFREECGVFGIFGHAEAANMTYLGLYALQHRGQESAGIAASDGQLIRLSRAMGYVADVFDSRTLSELPGSMAIGHVRYSTAGE